MFYCILLSLLFAGQPLTASQVSSSHSNSKNKDILENIFNYSLFQDETLERQRRTALANKFKELKKLTTINMQDPQGYTPLMLAIRGLNLTTYGANQEDQEVTTEPTDPAWIDWILSKKPDINIQAHDKETALHLAIQQQDVPLVTKLLSAGADTSLTDASGKRPIDYVIIAGDDDRNERARKEELQKLLQAHAAKLRQSTHGAFDVLYDETEFNMPSRLVSNIADYMVTKP